MCIPVALIQSVPLLEDGLQPLLCFSRVELPQCLANGVGCLRQISWDPGLSLDSSLGPHCPQLCLVRGLVRGLVP